MNELEKLYTLWSENQTDSNETKEVMESIFQDLIAYLPEEESEEMVFKIYEYSLKIEKQAFIVGYKHAFLLMLEIINPR